MVYEVDFVVLLVVVNQLGINLPNAVGFIGAFLNEKHQPVAQEPLAVFLQILRSSAHKVKGCD
jgi:hypothetical protein